MGTKPQPRARAPRAPSLASALFTITQQRVLGYLFGQPDRSFYAQELIALTRSGSGAVQRELAHLAQSGLVTQHPVGNRKHYQANPDSPLYAELCSIARKTFGLAEPLRAALQPLAPRIHAAFVYGSVAKGSDTAASDIDLLLISDTLAYGELYLALEAPGAALGRPLNPTLYTRKDYAAALKARNAFLTRVTAGPKLWIVGDEHDLGV